ncbi:MAG: hypothetical protein ISR39_00395 [Akkermansiaceae bacterium]|nr:hypothetical protein [Akkermansiaceae bacterium]MDC0550176.1 hypothetical protein [bacterium]MDB2429066.1 hypothetical protein [Akkermansiaceae bacterium]MDB4577026.1 hypothetical protein [Akkermansiaceae bacterium]MDB4730813.1 hypothetical protein [Akkermansiaceae bacterium]
MKTPYFLTQKMNSSKLPLTCLFMADSEMPEKIAKMKAFTPLPSQKKQLNAPPNWRL